MKRILVGLFLFSIFILGLSLFIGPVKYLPFKALQGDEIYKVIFWNLRLPRILMAFAVGASLSLSGLMLQTLFQNPLMDPYLLGISSGGALFAFLSSFIPLPVPFKFPLFSLLGSILIIGVVMRVARQNHVTPVFQLLLSGIALSLLASGILSFLLYLQVEKRPEIFFYLFGTLSRANWIYVLLTSLLSIAGLAFLFLRHRELDILLWGEESAHSMGISVEHLKKEIIFFSAVMSAIAVAVSGIIGFVGLMVPHIGRLWVGIKHRSLGGVTFFIGGLLLLICDDIARGLSGWELPVGIFTSLLGVPFFILLMKRGRII